MASLVERPAAGAIVHLKGFALRVNFSDPNTKACADDLVANAVKELTPADAAAPDPTLVWDGDSFNESSFAALVPRIKVHSR